MVQFQRDMKKDCVPSGIAVPVKNCVFYDCHEKFPCLSQSNLKNMEGIPTCRQSLLGGKYGPDSKEHAPAP